MLPGQRLPRDGRPITMWNRDCTDYPDLNLYGSHPFYMEIRPGMVLLHVSHLALLKVSGLEV